MYRKIRDGNCLAADLSFSGNLTKFDIRIGEINSSISLPNQYADIRQGPWINNFFLSGDNHTHIQLPSSLLPKVGHFILELVFMTPILNDSDEEGAFDALKSLRLFDCGGLEYLGRRRSTNAAFANLEDLRLEKLVSMKGLGEGVPNPGSFQNLRILEIRKCDQLSRVIRSNWIRNFPKLEQLHVGSCSSVTEIIDMEEISKELEMTPPLANIKKLHLQSLKGLLSICKGPGKILSFSNLTELDISDCPTLAFIFSPYMSQTLFHLQELSIARCNNLRVIFEEADEGAATDEIQPLEFPELIKMTVHQCEGLECLFPVSIARGLVNLEELYISGCKSLTENFKSTEEGAAKDETLPLEFPELNKMTVHHCEELRSLFPVFSGRGLVNLVELYISDCEKLEVLVSRGNSTGAEREANSNEIKLPQLRKTILGVLSSFKRFFPDDYYMCLPSLQELIDSGFPVGLTWLNAADSFNSKIPRSARIIYRPKFG